MLKDQEKLAAFDGNNPILAGLLDLVQQRHGARLSRMSTTPPTPTSRPTSSSPRWCQRVVIDGWDFDQAMDEAQTQGQAIYDKYRVTR